LSGLRTFPRALIRAREQSARDLTHDGVPQEVFLALPFDKKVAQGTVVFHEGFLASG
jgi:hypothetical protein